MLTLRSDSRQESIMDHLDLYGFTMADAGSNEVITQQKGVFRTNCLDWYVLVMRPLCVLSNSKLA